MLHFSTETLDRVQIQRRYELHGGSCVIVAWYDLRLTVVPKAVKKINEHRMTTRPKNCIQTEITNRKKKDFTFYFLDSNGTKYGILSDNFFLFWAGFFILFKSGTKKDYLRFIRVLLSTEILSKRRKIYKDERLTQKIL